jgi:hypothetical protein
MNGMPNSLKNHSVGFDQAGLLLLTLGNARYKL